MKLAISAEFAIEVNRGEIKQLYYYYYYYYYYISSSIYI